MYTSNARFGDTRSKQSKLQKRRQSESGSGRRRMDPSIHATSRPWHTSTPGIRMNVTTLGQIASRDPVAAKYLDRMNLSGQAQKKRGKSGQQEGRGYDKMGMAMKQGLQSSVANRKAYGAPNQDTIDKWSAELSGRIAGVGTRPPVSDRTRTLAGRVNAGPAGERAYARAKSAVAKESMYDRQITALRGMKSKLPKRPYHVSGMNIHRYQY